MLSYFSLVQSNESRTRNRAKNQVEWLLATAPVRMATSSAGLVLGGD
jgi:hypothetical protein